MSSVEQKIREAAILEFKGFLNLSELTEQQKEERIDLFTQSILQILREEVKKAKNE